MRQRYRSYSAQIKKRGRIFSPSFLEPLILVVFPAHHLAARFANGSLFGNTALLTFGNEPSFFTVSTQNSGLDDFLPKSFE